MILIWIEELLIVIVCISWFHFVLEIQYNRNKTEDSVVLGVEACKMENL